MTNPEHIISLLKRYDKQTPILTTDDDGEDVSSSKPFTIEMLCKKEKQMNER